MRRLDQSLTRLAERGQRVGADALIERIARQLELGTDPVVVALDSRRTAMQTREEMGKGPAAPKRRRGPWIAAAAFGVVIAVVSGALLLTTDDGSEEGLLLTTDGGSEEGLLAWQPPDLLDEFVSALQHNDAESSLSLVNDSVTFHNHDFIRWLIGLDTSGVEFTDCVPNALETVYTPDGALIGRLMDVTCSISMGPDWFYSRITGEVLEAEFSARVFAGAITIAKFDALLGVAEADREFEAWVEQVYPERYDEMFAANSELANILFDDPSGAARTELAAEYLASQ